MTAMVSDYYRDALGKVQEALTSEGADLARMDTDEFADHLVSQYALDQFVLHEDEATQTTGRRFEADRDIFGSSYQREVDTLRIEIPCDPHPRHVVLRQLRANEWRSMNVWKWEYDSRSALFRLDSIADAATVNREIEDLRWRVTRLNADVAAQNATFRETVVKLIEARKRALEARGQAVNDAIAAIDLPLSRNTATPARAVDLAVRHEIAVLRPKPAPQAQEDFSLEPAVVDSVVAQVWGFTSIWERSPETYAKLEEEELRDNLVAFLNAMFESPGSAATGETFSKYGKTDIYLSIPKVGASVLVFECKWWSGQGAYSASIDQLFGYLPWRQTFAVLVTFVGNTGFTEAIERAKQATSGHASTIPGSLKAVGESRFTTQHQHPEDAARRVLVHHLLIHLPRRS